MAPAASNSDKLPSLAEQAYATLESLLVTLELAPGLVVSEGQLNEMVGLGRTPVREAMLRLAHQDLIRVMPRKGLMIAPIDRLDLLQILEVRRPLEQLIVTRAALNAKDEQRSALSAIARGLSITHDSFEEFLKLDHELDSLLDECAGNSFASVSVAPLRIHCRRFWYHHRYQMQLSDAISANSKMARLVARREYYGAQKASDGVIAVMERLVAGIER